METDGHFAAVTDEALDAGVGPASSVYSLSEQLEISGVDFNENFAVWHRRYEQEGKLKHKLEACPLLTQPMAVRRWDRESGWTTVQVPPRRPTAPLFSPV